MVAPGRGHLDGVAGVLHAGQVGEVELVDTLGAAPRQQPAAGHLRHRWGVGHGLVAQLGDHLGQRAHPEHRPCRGPSRPRAPAARARTPGGCPGRPRPSPSAARPGTARSPPARVGSPIEQGARQPRPRDVAGGRQHGHRDGQVEVGARAWAGRPGTAGSSSGGWPASRSWLLMIAIRHRSRASLSEASGRPTRVVPTCPATRRPGRRSGGPGRR